MAYVKSLGQNGKTSEENRVEILRILRNTISEENDREQIGGCIGISAKKVLLSYLFQLEASSQRSNYNAFEGEEIQEGIMRSMWAQKKFARSSHRSKYKKQHDREHPDSLQTLSSFLAYDSEEAWASYRWENANPILSKWKPSWEDGIARIVNRCPYRVDRLKALGNAVVPQQAKEAFKILMGINE